MVEQIQPRQIFDPIPTGPAPPVGWDPDDHVWRNIAGSGPGQMRVIEQTNVPPTAIPANTWTDVVLGPSGIVVPAGAAMILAKVCVRDTSGAANTIQARMYVGPPAGFSVLDSAIVSVPANGYATLFMMQSEFTSVDINLKLAAFGTGACSVIGPSGQPDTPQTAIWLALWLTSQSS